MKRSKSKRDAKKKKRQLDEHFDIDQETESITISIGKLNEQLQSLKHEIDIETIQHKIKIYESIFKKIGGDIDTLVEMINWYKKQNIKK